MRTHIAVVEEEEYEDTSIVVVVVEEYEDTYI
jgi:hypothetical protein